MYKRGKAIWLMAVVLILIGSTNASADPVEFVAVPLGGGLFQYSLVINNPANEPISGLNLLHANSIFGLTPDSIKAVSMNVLELIGGSLKAVRAAVAASGGVIGALAGRVTVRTAQARTRLGGDTP